MAYTTYYMLHQRAPTFSLSDQNGINRSLKDYVGRWIVLYFYPHDNTLHCTKEACNFRDEYRIISQFGDAEIIGINHGSVASHKKFAERHSLHFPILSDTGHTITSLYNSWRSNKPALPDRLFGTRRNTYIIDPSGIIAKVYLSVDPHDHAHQIITDLQELQRSYSANRA